MNTQSNTRRRFLFRALSFCLLLVFLHVVGFAVYLATFGFPDWMAAKVVRRVNLGVFHWETTHVRLDPRRGFVFENVRVYRKKVLGPPAIEAAKVVVYVDPVSLYRGESAIRGLRINDGVIRPHLASGPKTQQTSDEGKAPQSMRFTLHANNCAIMGIDVEKLSCQMRVKGPLTRFNGIEATLKNKTMRGEFSGNGSYDGDKEALDMHILTKLDPHMLLPVIQEWDSPFTAELVRRFEFKSPPKCDLHFTRPCATNASFALDGQFWLQDGSYAGIDLLRADGTIALSFSDTNSIVSVSPLLIIRREGIASGGFTVDTISSNVQFDAISGVDPKAILRMAGIFTNHELDIFRLNGPVRTSAKGTVNYGDLALTDFHATGDADNMGLGPLDMEKCSFSMRMTGLTNVVTNITGRAYGGDFSGSAVFVLPAGERTNTAYTVAGRIKDADFGRFARCVKGSVGAQEDYKGQLSARLSVQGLMGTGDNKSIKGNGAISIKNGLVFMLPVFGGLSHIMTRIIPGLDFVLRQTDAKADFTIAEGTIHSDEVRVEGDILSLNGKGDYKFNGELDFDVELRFLKEHTLTAKIVRIPTYLISKLFKLRLRGTYENPHWYPVNFSRDLLEKLHITEKKE